MKPWIKVLLGLFLGIAVGLIAKQEIPFLKLLGNVFIDLLKMLVSLIVFASVVPGICHIHDPKKLGRIGLKTLLYYLCTTVIAISFGLICSFFLQPGAGLSLSRLNESAVTTNYSFLAFITSLVPVNPIASFAEGKILQIIVFSMFFAYAIILSGEKGKPVLCVIESLAEIMYALAHFIMKLVPYGVFALIATAVGSIGLRVIFPLLKFLIANYIACLLQIFVIFGGSIRYLAKLEVVPFFKGMKDAIVLAFTTSSSSATLPVSLECVRDHLGVSKNISGFVLSLGSTINMNGAAIGQASAAYFIAQAYGIELTSIKIGILFFVSLVSSIGAAGIPGTGIVMLSIVLNALGLPLEGIAMLAGVDRIREMLSAVTNVLGDAAAAVYVATSEKEINQKQYRAVTWLE